MSWKLLKEQPPEWINLPNLDEHKLRTSKDRNADNRNAKKLIAWTHELAEQFDYPVDKNDPVLNQLLKQIQSGQYKEINIQASLLEDSKLQPTVFHFTYGKIISQIFIKDISDCNATDVLFLRNFKLPPDTFYQLKSAITILFSVFMEHFIGDAFQSSLDIRHALELTLQEIKNKPSPNQKAQEDIFLALIVLDGLLQQYCDLPEQLTFQELLKELDIIKALIKIRESEKRENLKKKNGPETLTQHCIRQILELFLKMINLAIDIGLLDKFKVSTMHGNANISIATNHLLLNEKKMLSRLNGDERSQRANQGKTQITKRIKQKIKEQLKTYSNEKYKSINEAAEQLSLLLADEITQIIHDDQQSYQHNFQYGEDHYFELLKSILRADTELKSQYTRKPLKNNK
ncbi:hypothetical protein [Acinetobacter colistiniresistens]|uniref:Uncharacterized protein n=1 Tax=Acinetobacter colistiniresistens TaxID=280145 RepID=A0A558FMN8_9GAMM|nr:hypothetical protein [Acinetobacter colistiniresistens]TVT86787.1 hypothetical protein FPV60_02550 [Acinetobacter colistiniresistens]